MESNDVSRTIFDLRIISIAVVIAIIVGAVAGYMVGNSPILGYKEEINRLENEYQLLNSTYTQLAETFKISGLENYYKEIQFNITLPEVNDREHRQWLFSPGYGVVMQVHMVVYSFEDDYLVEAEVNWLRGDNGHSLGGYGIHYAQLPKFLTGAGYCKILREDEGTIVFAAGIKTDQPLRELERYANFPKKPP